MKSRCATFQRIKYATNLGGYNIAVIAVAERWVNLVGFQQLRGGGLKSCQERLREGRGRDERNQ